jgi:hypothetical protein
MTNKNENNLFRSLDDVSRKFLLFNRNSQPSINQAQTGMEALQHGGNFEYHLQQAVIIAHPELLTDTPGVFINSPDPRDNKYEYVTLVDISEAPQLEVIDLSRYNGQPGCPIRIKVNKEYRVAEIWVSISSIDGSVCESGMARANDSDSDWIYTSSKSISFMDGRTIHIRYSDVPGYLIRPDYEFWAN